MKTFGWDAVFVADVAEINKTLAKSAAKLVEKFSFSAQGFHVVGTFGAWEIVPGGSGDLLELQVTIATGTLSTDELTQPIDLTGVKVVLTVSLKLLPDPEEPRRKVLMFHFDSVADHTTSDRGNGVVSFSRLIAADGLLTYVQQAAVGMAVASALVENAAYVSFVFATVNPLAAAKAEWLRPHNMAYCYLDVLGTGAQMLSILCVNSDRPIDDLQEQLDPTLLAADRDAGLAISESLVLEHVLIPALAESFKTSASKFRVAPVPGPTGQGIVLDGSFNLPAVHKVGQTYTPVVHALHAVVEDTQVKVNLSGSCDMKMGIRMDFQASSTIGARFSAPDRTLAFTTIGKPVFHKQIHIPWYDHLFDLISWIAEIVLNVVVNVIGNELAKSIAQVSSVKDISSCAPDLVGWLGGTEFTPEQGGLATSLYLRGHMN